MHVVPFLEFFGVAFTRIFASYHAHRHVSRLPNLLIVLSLLGILQLQKVVELGGRVQLERQATVDADAKPVKL